ncbi:MAG: DVUA0089 family protein, partial [Gaiellaceae bacterium]
MTPGFIRTAACAVIAALALALAPGAFAANEAGDAGDLRVTANDMGGSAVTQINGTFTDAMDADLYRVCLSDGASFSASTVGATTLDTQMFLFDGQGYGVYANDDWGSSRGSMLPAQHRFSPQTGGVYYLAVSQYNRDPQSSQGEIFQDNFSGLAFP